jgi:hypothetical protein
MMGWKGEAMHRYFLSALAGAALVFCFSFARDGAKAASSSVSGTTMGKKIEYKIVITGTLGPQETWDKLGEEGWEFVTVLSTNPGTGCICVFRRSKSD